MTDWERHISKISIIGGALALLGALLPSSHVIQPTLISFVWYWGFLYMSTGGSTITGMIPFPEYGRIGIITIVLLIIAMIVMFISTKYKERKLIAAGVSLVGGILALIGPIIFYFYIQSNIIGYWLSFTPSIGFWIPIVAGIIGILGAIAFGIAYMKERG